MKEWILEAIRQIMNEILSWLFKTEAGRFKVSELGNVANLKAHLNLYSFRSIV